jgi:hypothetical protein
MVKDVCLGGATLGAKSNGEFVGPEGGAQIECVP